MATKKYDIAVAVGEYQSEGQTKKRYQNVGVVMQGDNGPYILLERWFNPAGVANPDNRGNLILSLFEPREGNGGGGNNRSQAQQSNNTPDDGGDIPF